MTIDINKNSALIDSAASGYSGCGCGNRRYYTKAEIDEMLKDVLSPDEIKEILDEMFEEYIEGSDLYELILSVIGDIYTKDEIDEMLSNYATRGWVREYTEENYLKDITITINGTELHNNGDIIIEGGGGEPVDISGKLDTTAFTQAMQNETARTEDTYAKKSDIPSLAGYATKTWVQSQGYLTQHQDISGKVDKTDFNSFTATTNQCCDYVKGEITDIWAAIAEITGDTPTPPTPAGDWVIRVYLDVTSTTIPTKVAGQLAEHNFTKAILDNGSDIIDNLVWQTGTGFEIGYYYTFGNTGTRYIDFYYKQNITPYVTGGFVAVPSMFEAVVNDNVPRLENIFRQSDNLTSVTIGNNVQEIGLTCFYGCDGLTGVTIPASVKLIGKNAFAMCSNMEVIVFNEGLLTVKEGGFKQCSSLDNVSLPNTLRQLESNAFSGCTSLTNITFGYNLNFLGDSCFEGCSALESITFTAASTPTLDGDRVFYGVSPTGTYYYPSGSDYTRIANALPQGWIGVEI